MNVANFIAILAVTVGIITAIRYLIVQHKRGNGCAGCSSAGACKNTKCKMSVSDITDSHQEK